MCTAYFCAWLIHASIYFPPLASSNVPRRESKRLRRLLLLRALCVWALLGSAWAYRTWTRNMDWHDEDALLRSNLEHFPMNSMCLCVVFFRAAVLGVFPPVLAVLGVMLLHTLPRICPGMLVVGPKSTQTFGPGLERGSCCVPLCRQSRTYLCAAPDTIIELTHAIAWHVWCCASRFGTPMEALADMAFRRGDIDLAIEFTRRGTRFGASAHRLTNLFVRGASSVATRHFDSMFRHPCRTSTPGTHRRELAHRNSGVLCHCCVPQPRSVVNRG